MREIPRKRKANCKNRYMYQSQHHTCVDAITAAKRTEGDVRMGVNNPTFVWSDMRRSQMYTIYCQTFEEVLGHEHNRITDGNGIF